MRGYGIGFDEILYNVYNCIMKSVLIVLILLFCFF